MPSAIFNPAATMVKKERNEMWTCARCGKTDLFDPPATTSDGEDACLDCEDTPSTE